MPSLVLSLEWTRPNVEKIRSTLAVKATAFCRPTILSIVSLLMEALVMSTFFYHVEEETFSNRVGFNKCGLLNGSDWTLKLRRTIKTINSWLSLASCNTIFKATRTFFEVSMHRNKFLLATVLSNYYCTNDQLIKYDIQNFILQFIHVQLIVISLETVKYWLPHMLTNNGWHILMHPGPYYITIYDSLTTDVCHWTNRDVYPQMKWLVRTGSWQACLEKGIVICRQWSAYHIGWDVRGIGVCGDIKIAT